jgi:hypothetical protein
MTPVMSIVPQLCCQYLQLYDAAPSITTQLVISTSLFAMFAYEYTTISIPQQTRTMVLSGVIFHF